MNEGDAFTKVMTDDDDEGLGSWLKKVREKHSEEVEVFKAHVSDGLTDLSDPKFLQRRYREFQLKHDPVYAELLKGMGDEALAKTFVSYWTIAHTLATRSRFWIEEAIADILIQRAKKAGRDQWQIYSQSMLGHGWLDRSIKVADIGELQREHLSERRPWRVQLQRRTLAEIDVLVGEQERERIREEPRTVQDLTAPRRAWLRKDPTLVEKDRKQLMRVAASIGAPPASAVTLQCNLLVIEPNKRDERIHAWAIRFVNPKAIASHATRKQERVNLLRLYAWLVQEKILRDPAQIDVGVAELYPRYTDFDDRDRYPDYFSSLTYWSCDRLWQFLDMPFDVVTAALRDVATEFRGQLIGGLRGLLPDAEERDLPDGGRHGGAERGRSSSATRKRS